jgi:hypothetical protein
VGRAGVGKCSARSAVYFSQRSWVLFGLFRQPLPVALEPHQMHFEPPCP